MPTTRILKIQTTSGVSTKPPEGVTSTKISDDKKKKWSWWDSFFLFSSVVTLSESASWILGYYDRGLRAFWGPLLVLSDPFLGPIVSIFGLTIAGIIFIYIWEKKFSWITCRKWLIVEAICLGVAGITMSMFPQFSMRHTIMSIPTTIASSGSTQTHVKSWKTVFSKEFVGVGFTGGDEPKDNDGTIHIAKIGKNFLIGDRLIIKSQTNNIEIWDESRWQKYKHPIINRIGTHGDFCARAKKGVKFKLIVQRFK